MRKPLRPRGLENRIEYLQAAALPAPTLIQGEGTAAGHAAGAWFDPAAGSALVCNIDGTAEFGNTVTQVRFTCARPKAP